MSYSDNVDGPTITDPDVSTAKYDDPGSSSGGGGGGGGESSMDMSDYAYPLANYNWDYKTYVVNNYEPSRLGVSDDLTLSALRRDVQAGDKYLRALMIDSTPNENSIAGISDLDFTDPDVMSRIRANSIVIVILFEVGIVLFQTFKQKLNV